MNTDPNIDQALLAKWKKNIIPNAAAEKLKGNGSSASNFNTQPKAVHINLTEDEFCEQYKPEECPDGSLYVQRHYDDPEDHKELLKAQNEHKIWTVVECDGKWSACNWPAYVNRLYYLITTKPYNPNHVICVNLE